MAATEIHGTQDPHKSTFSCVAADHGLPIDGSKQKIVRFARAIYGSAFTNENRTFLNYRMETFALG